MGKENANAMYTLLIADDEAHERDLIRFLLRDSKHILHILEAQNGRDAFEQLSNNHVDILLCDIEMPFLNGIELAKKVKEQNPDIEILFFSGYDDFVYVKAALSLKAVSYILKPVDPAEFDKLLTEIISRLDSKKIEFAKSDQYIEAHFHDTIPQIAAKEINHPDYGRFVWITENTNGKFDVEICKEDGTFRILVTCKNLASAKRWISMNINY